MSIAILVEFGRRGVRLQWEPEAWHAILGYRPWPPPAYAAPGTLRLIERTGKPEPDGVIARTQQYLLLARP
jgi:hypothetical protein